MAINRRLILSGLALPAIVGVAMPGRAEAQVPGLPDPALPIPSLPTVAEATHDAVLTEATATALQESGIVFAPSELGEAVPDATRPSTRLKLSVGAVALDLLSGTVHFDGGFKLSSDSAPEREVCFVSFAAQLAEGETSALVCVDGQMRERVRVFTFDLTQATIDVQLPNLTLGQYPLTLTEEAVSVIQEVFPDAPVGSTDAFSEGSATAVFEPVATQR